MHPSHSVLARTLSCAALLLGAAPRPPQDAPVFEPLPGFHVETVAGGLGSLVAIALDESGRLFASVEAGPVLRLVDGDGDGRFETAEPWLRSVTDCQGLHAEGSTLFAVGQGPEGQGLYRVVEQEDGTAGAPVLLGHIDGKGGEHGPHAVVPGPDGRLFVVIGNHVRLREPVSEASPYRIAQEGSLLPPFDDPLGHAAGLRAPGGVVLSVDRDGREWRLEAGGLRNAYDIAFSSSGDLFTFDSDMEWDVGLPWYRPVRLLHVVPGGEYGWRTGSSKWPDDLPDSLPGAADVGRGSPTGLVTHPGTGWPSRFRGAILGGDWSKGEILAFHLEPEGASWRARTETLLRGRPLSVTDLVVEPSGSLLFSTGGRGVAGGIWRLVHEGPAGVAPLRAPEVSRLPRIDRTTERAVLLASLASPDRFVRFLAARALERRDPAEWESEAAALPSARARAEALVALARLGARCEADVERRISESSALLDAPPDGASPPVRVVALRALELLLLDPSAPARASCASLGARLLRLYPTGESATDRLLVQAIAFLAPQGAIGVLLDALERSPSRTEQIHLAYGLRAIEAGWTPEERERFSAFLVGSVRWRGGESFVGYLLKILDDFARRLDPDERAALLAAASAPARVPTSVSSGAPRDFDATLAFVERAIDAPRRSAAEGAFAFESVCVRCHRFGDAGGRVGSDLTTVGARFSVRDLVIATLDPSRQISDQYRATDLFLREGGSRSGILVSEDADAIVLLGSDGARSVVAVSDVEERRPSPISTMPMGLVDGFTLEQVADLFAYVRAGRAVSPPEASLARPAFPLVLDDSVEGDRAIWRIERGDVTGEVHDGARGERLLASGELADGILELEVRIDGGTGGLLVRVPGDATEAGASRRGVRIGVGGDDWGTLFDAATGARLAQPKREVWRSVVDLAGFNHLLVELRGERIAVELNGAPMVSFDDVGAPRTGRFGLELSTGDSGSLRVRNARIRPIGP